MKNFIINLEYLYKITFQNVFFNSCIMHSVFFLDIHRLELDQALTKFMNGFRFNYV